MATKKDPKRRRSDVGFGSPAMMNCGKWSDSRIFVMAAAGAAIGLNNVWQFPHLIISYGGSAFLLTYLAALLLLGWPLMTTEILIGRRGGFSPINSIRLLIMKDACDGRWTFLGWVLTFVGILILSYLSVIAGWTIAYAVRAGSGTFSGITPDGVRSMFYTFAADPEKQLFWHSLFVFSAMLINACGLRVGMQRFVRYGLPTFFVVLGILAIYSIGLSNPVDNLAQLFRFDHKALGLDGIFIAVGHAVFSLGLGVGVLIVYSSHLEDDVSLPKTSLKIIGLDTLAGLLSAFIVVSLISVIEVSDTAGPGLIFQSIPQVLDNIPYGNFIGSLFFLSLTLAALLTAVALVEPAISWLVESWGMTRANGAVACGLVAWLLGVATILSFNYWGFQTELVGIEIRRGYFDIMQIFTSYIMIPLAIILSALFLGWGLNRKVLTSEIPFLSGENLVIAVWSLRIIIPAIVLFLFYNLYRLNL